MICLEIEFLKTFHFIILFTIALLLITPIIADAQNRYPDHFPKLNKFYSQKTLGLSIEDGNTFFRVFAPTATAVKLVTFDNHDDQQGTEYEMKQDQDGVWEFKLDGIHEGKYYGYRIDGPKNKYTLYDPEKIIADPYSKAVVTQNNYHHPGKSIIVNTDYDWEGDTWIDTPLQDLIIYEMHVRDLTIHPSAGVDKAGTYSGVIENGKTGGLNYLLDLGVNAVELLPCHDFGNIEVPYKDKSAPVYNTWNPYERNHWGYMTSYFFAPESYYASGGNMERDNYCGIHGQQINDFKDMVKALHKNGIAVIMDVVYNHVSQYDLNPFKYIDRKYYFRLDKNGKHLTKSGCGNDFMTERPMARRMIIESVKYWMTEYHIDGFRFDLAYLIDEQTCKEIIEEARKINPNVYIIAEPWGDGYAPDYFSKIGWAAWNDKIRNGVKGQNPFDNPGFIFGKWERDTKPDHLKRYILGSITEHGGQFQKAEHSINYLESHDDHTFGDFVRITTGGYKKGQKVKDMEAHVRLNEHMEAHVRLNEQQLKISKLGALFLFASKGAVMIHQGQEFARSKVIAETNVPESHVSEIDHNSYNKDNETNWINYNHREWNRELYDYYQGLIQLRKKYPALSNAPKESYQFLKCKNEFAIGFVIDKTKSDADQDIAVLINGDPNHAVQFKLPKGNWPVIVNKQNAGSEPFGEPVSGKITLEPTSGVMLVQ